MTSRLQISNFKLSTVPGRLVCSVTMPLKEFDKASLNTFVVAVEPALRRAMAEQMNIYVRLTYSREGLRWATKDQLQLLLASVRKALGAATGLDAYSAIRWDYDQLIAPIRAVTIYIEGQAK